MKFKLIFIGLLLVNSIYSQEIKLGLLKYQGGGDWYANPSSLPNLIHFCNKELGTKINPEPETIEVGSKEIFNYPYLFMTGHGNVIFTESETANLRLYLEGGGFLHIDDNYGMNDFIREQLKKVFPEIKLTELPDNHPIFKQKFSFPQGLPKIHEHDSKPSQAFGIILNGRLACLYTYECDLGDGWEDPSVHRDSETTRLNALRMGANIIQYVFLN